MHFALSQEQEDLAAVVRDLLDKHPVARTTSSEQPRAYDAKLWRLLCDQVGAAALAIPEEYGGAGFTLLETHVVLEQLGGALAATPMLGSAVLAAQALLLSGDDLTCRALLPGIAAGETVASVAWAGQDSRWRTRDLPLQASAGATSPSVWTISGSAALVLDGAEADVLLVLASAPEGATLFTVDPRQPGVRRAASPAMDQTLRLARVDLDAARGEAVGSPGSADVARLRDIAVTAVSALQVGAAQRCLDMTVAYTSRREQFGRPIGSFQALKHRMADMLVGVETARSASWAAAWSAARRDADLPVRAATAKAWCSEALSAVASETVQLHGGIAITWEHDAQRYFKRAHATWQLFGQPHEHRQRLFELYGLAG